MSAATDKARFYLEQTVPELRELSSKQIFTPTEIRSINRKRSDFEHKLNAPGSSPSDWARYLEYELNLDTLRRKRAKRIGAKVTRHSGPRRIFALLERATSKFHGDLGLWMQYLDYAKKQKAYKRISAVWTKVVRLHPAKAELWAEAGRWAFDEQSDMAAARGYMQRGLRFCPTSTELWVEYFSLELDYLARVSARAKGLGIGQKEGVSFEDEDDNKMMLPDTTADEAFGDEDAQVLIGSEVLQELGKSPALSGAIPMAIFDAAMKAFSSGAATNLAADMFDTAVNYDMPSRQAILDHISTKTLDRAPSSAAAQNMTIRLPIVATSVNTADFARSLARAISEMHKRLAEENQDSARLHLLSARWIVSYLRVDDLDSGIAQALRATLDRVLSSYQTLLENPTRANGQQDTMSGFAEANEVRQLSGSLNPPGNTANLLQAMSKRWPAKTAKLEEDQQVALVAQED